jgi:hypothetical protein
VVLGLLEKDPSDAWSVAVWYRVTCERLKNQKLECGFELFGEAAPDVRTVLSPPSDGFANLLGREVGDLNPE